MKTYGKKYILLILIAGLVCLVAVFNFPRSFSGSGIYPQSEVGQFLGKGINIANYFMVDDFYLKTFMLLPSYIILSLFLLNGIGNKLVKKWLSLLNFSILGCILVVFPSLTGALVQSQTGSFFISCRSVSCTAFVLVGSIIIKLLLFIPFTLTAYYFIFHDFISKN